MWRAQRGLIRARACAIPALLAATLATLAHPRSAFAEGPSVDPTALAPGPTLPPSPLAREQPVSLPPPPGDKPVRIGVLGGIGFPDPFSLEALVKVRGLVSVGAEGGFLPSVTLPSVSVSMWSVSADLRVYPFHRAFFLGLRGGYQHLAASTTVVVPPYGSANEALTMNSGYLNPRLGFLWTLHSGFTVGIDAGVQVPVVRSFSTTLPEQVAILVRDNTLVKTLNGVLPTADLLRLGALF
jgi:hypothetical protein